MNTVKTKLNLASSITEIMSRHVTTLTPTDTAAEALRLMVDGINTLPVVDNCGRCVGMIARGDLLEDLLREDQELARFIEAEGAPSIVFGAPLNACNERLVSEFMSDQPTFADRFTSIAQACEMMSSQAIHHLPVVDDERKVIGMVSTLDLAGWLVR